MEEKDPALLRARQLRKEMTPHERKLWYLFLQKYPIKIYKQKIIGPYFLDFYCAPAKVAIEVDGTQHYEKHGQQHDRYRDIYLKNQGLLVLRYSNREIDRDFQSVCDHIHEMIQKRIAEKDPGQDR